MRSKIVKILIIAGFLGLFGYLASSVNVLGRMEKAECLKWQSQSVDYYTEWQKAQCERYGIILKVEK